MLKIIEAIQSYLKHLNESLAEYYGASSWDPKAKKMTIGGLQEGRLAVIQDGRTTHYSVDLSDTTVNYVETPLDGDRSRSIQLEWKHTVATGDVNLLGYAVRYDPGETQARESS